jgi:hypothetical protein
MGVGAKWGGKKFFFEKKNQKTFDNLGHGLWRGQSPCPRFIKVFCALFFKKALLPSLQRPSQKA